MSKAGHVEMVLWAQRASHTRLRSIVQHHVVIRRACPREGIWRICGAWVVVVPGDSEPPSWGMHEIGALAPREGEFF